MHNLGRAVRFSVNPFSPEIMGSNSYASKPTCEGLGLYFELLVELSGKVEPTSGFVVNVRRIDQAVRRFVVPEFAGRIQKDFNRGKDITPAKIFELLEFSRNKLANKFDNVRLQQLSLSVNPFRKISLQCEDRNMLYFSENFEFAAMHKLWNKDFSVQQNMEAFGKCANPTGHGHNYIIEVTVKLTDTSGRAKKEEFRMGEFERIVDKEFIELVDHKNLNADVPEFCDTNPTVENIAAFAWDKLAGKFRNTTLHKIRIWENDRTYCTYCEDQGG